MGLSTERDGRRARGDQGVALVEFSFVMVLLFTIVFGIIHYGLILSFKQDMTRAAAEAARAGAVAMPADHANVEAQAQAAADEAAKEFGGSTWSNDGCSRAGMSCSVSEARVPAPRRSASPSRFSTTTTARTARAAAIPPTRASRSTASSR